MFYISTFYPAISFQNWKNNNHDGGREKENNDTIKIKVSFHLYHKINDGWMSFN